MSGEGDLGTVAGFLEDETARTILAETSAEPMTVNELTERVDASKPTIYRRVEQLETADLLDASIRPDAAGHQETVYSATFDRLTVELDDGEYSFTLERTETMPERLSRFIEEL